MGKRIFFFGLYHQSMTSFATWLHLEAPPKNSKKINKYRLLNIELVLIHMILELSVLGIAIKLLMPSITLCKKFKKNLKFTAQGLPKTQSTIIRLIGILRIKRVFALYKVIIGGSSLLTYICSFQISHNLHASIGFSILYILHIFLSN